MTYVYLSIFYVCVFKLAAMAHVTHSCRSCQFPSFKFSLHQFHCLPGSILHIQIHNPGWLTNILSTDYLQW